MSEPLDTSKSTFEDGFWDGETWHEQPPYLYSFYEWMRGLDEEKLKKYWPKQWARKWGGLTKGHIYTYNVVKGRTATGFKPGDRVKLLHMRPELMMHVEVELQDENRSVVGLVHVCCLMLDGGMDNKGVKK